MRPIVSHEGRLALFQCPQHRGVVTRLRLFLSCLGDLDPLANATEIEEREGHHRSDEQSRISALEQRIDRSAEVSGARAQSDFWQILRSRGSNEQRPCRQLSLRAQHVGPATNELVGRPDVNRVGQTGERRAVKQGDGKGVRGPAEQYREATAIERDLRLESRRCRERQVEHRLGALRVERGAATGGEPVLRQLDDLLLRRRIPSRDGELTLRAPQVEVSASDFSRHAHLHVFETVLRGFGEGACCSDVATHAAEEVHLPRRIESDVP